MENSRNIRISRGVALVLLVAGILMAYLVLKALSQEGAVANETPNRSKKDTVYVQLLNHAFDSTLLGWNGVSKKRPDSPTLKTPPKNQANDQIPHGLVDGPSTQPTITPGMLSQAFSADKENNPGTLSFTTILFFCILFLAALGGIVYVHQLPPIPSKPELDRDPAVLDKVFSEQGDEIKKMGNPRRIKRFSNKVRFHFYFLSQSVGETRSMSNLDLSDTVKILLFLEANHSLMDMDVPKEDGGTKDLAWFVSCVVQKALGTTTSRGADDHLIAKLFELNKNIIV